MPVLEVKNLHICFRSRKGAVRAVNDVSFTLERGKTLGLVGESGSGKSVTAMSILRLLDGNGFIEKGEILLRGEGGTVDLARLSEKKLREIRGNQISVVFQEPMTALNPVFTVGRQLREPFLLHRKASGKESKEGALKMLRSVKIQGAEQVYKSYPHQLSGGMRQRVMIAMALSCQPKILIADEPTTALDVTVQAQILRLMRDLQRENGAAILFITHDLGIVREVADEVAVMYCGQVVERASVADVFRETGYGHPYTEGLLASSPSGKKKGEPLPCIAGNVPHPSNLPTGCKFSPRCPYATARCRGEEPSLFEVEKGRFIRCFYPKKSERRGENEEKKDTVRS